MTNDLIRARTFLITGASSGIGRALAERLASEGARVVLASRSADRTLAVVQAIQRRHPDAAARFLQVDLSDFASVRRAAAEFIATDSPLDVLINNAGVGGTFGLNADGIDLTYATNHLGPFLFTNLLVPRLQHSPAARIVNVSSAAHYQVKEFDWSMLAPRTEPVRSGFRAYAATKLMNVLHAKELARRLRGTSITTYSLHPGAVASNIWRGLPKAVQIVIKLFMLSNEEGARTPYYCATAPELRALSGRYYDRCREKRPSALSENESLAAELWSRSEAVLSRLRARGL
jgi:dehydrogenase/reductase SDR family protein 13